MTLPCPPSPFKILTPPHREEYRLESGTHAPLVGVLMEVTRAVRLMDGKLLILATAVSRFKVGGIGWCVFVCLRTCSLVDGKLGFRSSAG